MNHRAAFSWGIDKAIKMAALVLICMSSAGAACPNNLCDLATDGAYDNLVIGELVHVASDEELKQVFHWAKSHGRWQTLAVAFPPYLKEVKLVSIKTRVSAHPTTLFMTRKEYDASPLVVGQLVRYKPHDPDWEAPDDPQLRRLFYGLTGCVAMLCAKNADQCKGRYLTGVFSTQGEPLNPVTGQRLPDVGRINPQSLLPIQQ